MNKTEQQRADELNERVAWIDNLIGSLHEDIFDWHEERIALEEELERLNEMDERRLKVVYLRDSDVVKILNWRHADNGDRLTLGGPAIPDGVVVHHCYYDVEIMTTAVVLYHDSFGVVVEGCKIPMMFGAELSRVIQKGPDTSPVVQDDDHGLGRCVYCGMNLNTSGCPNIDTDCNARCSECGLVDCKCPQGTELGGVHAGIDVANAVPTFIIPDGDERVKSLDVFVDKYKDGTLVRAGEAIDGDGNPIDMSKYAAMRDYVEGREKESAPEVSEDPEESSRDFFIRKMGA